jgi:hypothetical protein
MGERPELEPKELVCIRRHEAWQPLKQWHVDRYGDLGSK